MVLKLLLFLLFLLKTGAVQHGNNMKVTTETEDSIPHHDKCQKITVPFCLDIPYNTTIMPNLLGHDSQESAGLEVRRFFPLVKINCSPHLQFFLCSVYVPVCTILDHPLPPCRDSCLSSKNGCEGIMTKFGFDWPDHLDCDNFPNNSNSNVLCVGPNQESSGSGTPSTSKSDSSNVPRNNAGFGSGLPRSGHDFSTGVQRTKHKGQAAGNIPKRQNPYQRDFGFVCPKQFKVPEYLEYSFKVGEKVEKNCGAPCNMMFFNEDKRQFSKIWVGTWALLCSASCLFTVATFLIDPDRFRYPERPIIFLSLCYLMVAFAYLAGFLAGDSIACRELNTSSELEHVSTITQGTKYEFCAILFMVLYFFSMASSIWWVVLTLTWFLAAGLKWGHEAIEANSQYFHLAAWAIPAIKTIVILAMGKVEGDILSGVCYVGIWNSDTMTVFVMIPLCIYLAFGTIFLASGFVSLFRIRTVMKHDGTRTDKLEKLMIRIGVFSVLYTVPAIIVIACLFYERVNFDNWLITWTYDMCQKSKYALPCPHVKRFVYPLFEVFMIKYLMCMIVGITSSVWIWSGKTVHSWRVFFHRIQGRHAEAYV